MDVEHAKILVVDDELDQRELLAGVFTRAGHDVECADSAAAALRQIRGTTPPDLICLDLSMPQVGGLDFLHQLRDGARSAGVPVIVISGERAVERRVESLDAGASDFVSKPVNSAELLARARNLLRAASELEKIQLGSFLDPLTGLLNRVGLDHMLGQQVELALRQHGALSVLFMDLDGFKRVNDVCGHTVGDEILCAVARALEAQLRGSDCAARWGGDEFVVVLPAAGPTTVARVVSRLEAAVAALAPAPGVTLGVSIGVASLYEEAPEDDTARRLIERADDAMYRVKRGARRTQASVG